MDRHRGSNRRVIGVSSRRASNAHLGPYLELFGSRLPRGESSRVRWSPSYENDQRTTGENRLIFLLDLLVAQLLPAEYSAIGAHFVAASRTLFLYRGLYCFWNSCS